MVEVQLLQQCSIEEQLTEHFTFCVLIASEISHRKILNIAMESPEM